MPTIYVLEQKRENNVYPCKPQFYYINVGCKGSSLHGIVFVMTSTDYRRYKLWSCHNAFVTHYRFFWILYYSKFDKDQAFISVCRISC